MTRRYSFHALVLTLIVVAGVFTGCSTIPETHEAGADIEVTSREGVGGTGISTKPVADREGMGGSGIDPDGMGGTGIIGVIAKNGVTTIAGVYIPSLAGAQIFLDGKPADSAALFSGRIAAVLIDNERAVREIRVFDQFMGAVPFIGSVSRLIVRGQIVGSTVPGEVTVNGLPISARALGGNMPGDRVRIDASAVPAGGFNITRVEKVSAGVERPESIETITKPETPSPVEVQPAEPVRPDIVTDRPARPERPEAPTPPQRIERPEIPEPPTLPGPRERPVLPEPPDRPVRPVVPDAPDRPVLDRPEPPVVVEPPATVRPPEIKPGLPPVDRPDLPRRLD